MYSSSSTETQGAFQAGATVGFGVSFLISWIAGLGFLGYILLAITCLIAGGVVGIIILKLYENGHLDKDSNGKIRKSAVIKVSAVILAFLSAIILLVVLCGNGSSKSGPDEADILVIAEKAVKSELKSPSTAKFSSLRQTDITKNDNVWTVSGWVDAQNSFGATLRNNYTVKITFNDNNEYKIDYCLIN